MLGLFLFALNSVACAVIAFYAVLLVKLLVYPIRPLRQACDRALVAISTRWTLWNTKLFHAAGGFRVDARIDDGIELSPAKRYLIVSNHQTWTDIFVLHALFHPRTPFLTFFLKRQLLYVPVFGVIWYALGFPFMDRHSPAQIEKNPALKGRDLAKTRKFCQRIRGKPYAIINFVEGTRRTPSKAKRSSLRNLLTPKAGGIATALAALDYEFDHVLDVTLRYEHERTSFVDLLFGRVGRVVAHVRELPLASIPRGDYFEDPAHAERFRTWLNDEWARKDDLFDALAPAAASAAARAT